MAGKQDEIICRKLKVLHPDIYDQLTESPPLLSDFCFIPDIIERIKEARFENNILKERHYIIGILIRIYDPEVLLGWYPVLKLGLRAQIASEMNTSGPLISNILKDVRNYYQVYKSFKTDVEYFSSEIAKVYASTEGK